MSYKISIVLLVLVTISFVMAKLKIGDMKQYPLIEIGEVGGKKYYAGTAEISWFAAKRLCEQNGFQFATARTPEEGIFLRETLAALDQFSHYWVAGSEQFVWEDTGKVIVGIGEIDEYRENDCLSIRIPDDPTPWDARPCEDTWPTLCQSATPM